MNNLNTLVKREFWEHRGAFVIMPTALAGLLIVAMIVGLLAVSRGGIDLSINDQDVEIFQSNSQSLDEDIERSIEKSVTKSIETSRKVKKSEERHIVIQFDEGDALVLSNSESEVSEFFDENKESLDAGLHGIHFAFLITSWFVVLVYLLNTLYADRRDRSILFWKSMPVSETQTVLTKLAVGLVAVPLVATAASWVVQLVYAVMAMIVASKMGQDPWLVIVPNLHILSAFIKQIGLVLYLSLWALPVCAWLMLASAYAKRSPFIVAVLPIVCVFILEGLLFRSTNFAEWISSHTPFNEDNAESLLMGNDLFSSVLVSNIVDITSGAIIAAGLLFGAVWLRNHRFEI